ncbi:ester cyclase [Chitinophaga oryzae]|uniref:Ester cyclase n=1 Tax=Chitinophaga oryzae TaxID=2725414 RepID=A0ABX6L9A6_9BACT|nr:ester cyclase [Chitinophaga oryzae]QJB36662.1 ester cyclase [Chitinophaga oryzae]
MATITENKEICQRFFSELHDKGNFNIIEELVDPNVISHDPFPGQPSGSEGVRSTMTIFRNAFPDLKLIHNDMIAEGDKVMIKFTATGTHKGEFMNIPPTGNKIAYEEVVILRLKDGKIVEHWAVADAMTLLQQLGVKEI